MGKGCTNATHHRLEEQKAPLHNVPMTVNCLGDLHSSLGQLHHGLRLLLSCNDAALLIVLSLLGELRLVDGGHLGRLRGLFHGLLGRRLGSIQGRLTY